MHNDDQQLKNNKKQTARRRSLQPFFNVFNKQLSPHAHKGFCLAVSGGPDSRALLETIAQWPQRIKSTIHILSIDHCARPESYDESLAVIARAKALGFYGNIYRLWPPTKVDEQSLRTKRYNVLRNYMREHDLNVLVTAHHRDDDAEGFLLNMLGWGGGVDGAGMHSTRVIDDIILIRPFLEFSKPQLLQVLFELGVKDYFCDPLDAAQVSHRAQVRKQLLPLCEQLQPNISNHIATLAQRQLRQSHALRSLANAKLKVHEKKCVEILIEKNDDPTLILTAIKCGLEYLHEQKTGRVSYKVLYELSALALDHVRDSFMVTDLKPKYFHLPGAVATVSYDGLVLHAK